MSFEVSGDAYDRFMGRYSRELAPVFADFAGVAAGQRVLDVGCGSGVLTEELVRRLGADHVAGADPSPLLEACARRVPGAGPEAGERRVAALAGRVLRRRARAARRPLHGRPGGRRRRDAARHAAGGVVAACTWDFGGGMALLGLFWQSVRAFEPGAARRRARSTRAVSRALARQRAHRHRGGRARGLDPLRGFRRAAGVRSRTVSGRRASMLLALDAGTAGRRPRRILPSSGRADPAASRSTHAPGPSAAASPRGGRAPRPGPARARARARRRCRPARPGRRARARRTRRSARAFAGQVVELGDLVERLLPARQRLVDRVGSGGSRSGARGSRRVSVPSRSR